MDVQVQPAPSPGGQSDLLEGQLRGPGPTGRSQTTCSKRAETGVPSSAAQNAARRSASTALTMIVAMRAEGAAPGSLLSMSTLYVVTILRERTPMRRGRRIPRISCASCFVYQFG